MVNTGGWTYRLIDELIDRKLIGNDLDNKNSPVNVNICCFSWFWTEQRVLTCLKHRVFIDRMIIDQLISR